VPGLAEDAVFPRLVSLACHDLRTPLATVSGFAHTLARLDDLGSPADRYVEMMITASSELADLLDSLALIARIESDRWEPTPIPSNTLDLARTVAGRLGDERVELQGDGRDVTIDVEAAERALYGFARCTLRHGGLERVTILADGSGVTIAPVTEAAAPIVIAEELRDLGSAVAMRVVGALGGSTALEGERLVIRLPS
jgi:signal transduction histidine kinase